MVSQLSDPCALRRVPVDQVDRDSVHLPAVRVESGWQIKIEGRWFTVIGDPLLLGECTDADGGRAQLWFRGPGVPVLDTAIMPRGQRIWARAPQPGAIETLGCVHADCAADGPFTLTGDGLMCRAHLAGYALAETAGPDDGQGASRG